MRGTRRVLWRADGWEDLRSVRKNGHLDAFTLAETDDQPPKRIITQFCGEADPGYHLTASKSRLPSPPSSALANRSGPLVMMTECALALTLDHDKLPALGRQGGVLTPATAMGDVLVDRLNKNELFDIRTVSLEEWRENESRKAR